MPNSISPNMNLVIPSVGLEPGPDYATDVNNSLSIVDLHDHTSGRGVQVTPAGLNLNSDVAFLSNNATGLRSIRFTSQGSPLALGTDKGCLYESGVDLYYNDGNGNQIRMTSSGSIVGTPGSITGLVSPASATYNAGTGTFIWQSNTNVAANMDNASVTIRIPNVVSSAGTTIAASLSLVTPYTITLPTAPPASLSLVTMDNSGNLGTTRTPSIDSLTVSGNITTTGSTVNIGTGGVVLSNTGTKLITNGDVRVGGVLELTSGGATLTNSSGTTVFSGDIKIGGSSGAVISNDTTFVKIQQLRIGTASTGPLLKESADTSGVLQSGKGFQPVAGGAYVSASGSTAVGIASSDGTRIYPAVVSDAVNNSSNGDRMIWGVVNTAGAVVRGNGFTSARNSAGNYTVSVSSFGFNSTPMAVCTSNSAQVYPVVTPITTTAFTVQWNTVAATGGVAADTDWMFIMMGPR